MWDFDKRIFFTEDERLENYRLNIMEEFMVAEVQLFISKDHQRATTMEGDGVSVEAKFTKGDAAPCPTENMIICQN